MELMRSNEYKYYVTNLLSNVIDFCYRGQKRCISHLGQCARTDWNDSTSYLRNRNALLLHRSLRLFSPWLWAVGRHVAYFATVEALEQFALSLGSRVGCGSGASGGSRFRRTFNVSPLGMQSRGAMSGMLILRNKRRRALAG